MRIRRENRLDHWIAEFLIIGLLVYLIVYRCGEIAGFFIPIDTDGIVALKKGLVAVPNSLR